MSNYAFILGIFANSFLAFIVLYSHFRLRKRLWPPPSLHAWQHHLVWWSVRVVAICVIIISFEEAGMLSISTSIRFYFALPLFGISAILGTLGFYQLGLRNTHGESHKFIATGLYKYSRNPQYLFYSISFISLGICIASPNALALLALASFWYLIAPFPEETWLQEQYGEPYIRYKNRVPRYFGFKNA